MFQRIRSLFGERKSVPPGDAEDVRIAARARLASEALLENENLTAELDDAAAKALLDWALESVKYVARSTAGLDDAQAEESMSPRLRAVRQLMRTVSKWASDAQPGRSESAALVLEKLLGNAATIYGEGFRTPNASEQQALLQQIPGWQEQGGQFITRLRGEIERRMYSKQ